MDHVFAFSQFRNIYGGLYIALEGLDGSGKTAQVQRLQDYFVAAGREVVTTREPRKQSGLLSEINHKILLGEITVPPIAFQYLFTADRILHHRELIIPALQADKVVISDRCFWSAIPYGSLDYGSTDIDTIARQLLTTQTIPMQYKQVAYPTVTFFLDVPAKIGIKRVPEKLHEKKEIYESLQQLEQAEKGYRWLLENFPEEFVVLDGKKSIDEVTTALISAVESI